MSELLKLQQEFAALVPGLLSQAATLGLQCTLGDAYRDPRVFGMLGTQKGYGHPRSAHKQRLALDLNLYREGLYLAETEDHRPLGEWWEKQHPLARWGGRFGDGNHYSFEYNGVK